MEPALKKGDWSPEEDRKLVSYIMKYGIWNWSQMLKYAGLARTGKSCRLRWMNCLRPDVRRGPFSMDDVAIVVQMWSAIAARLPGRTDNEIRNFCHTHLKRHLPAVGNAPSGLQTERGLRRTSRTRTNNSYYKSSNENIINNTNLSIMQPQPPNSCNNNSQENDVLDVEKNSTSSVVVFESKPNSGFGSHHLAGFSSASAMDMGFNNCDDDDHIAFWWGILMEAECLNKF